MPLGGAEGNLCRVDVIKTPFPHKHSLMKEYFCINEDLMLPLCSMSRVHIQTLYVHTVIKPSTTKLHRTSTDQC